MTPSWKIWMLRRVVAFVVAEAAMVVLGSTAHSLFVQRAWSGAAGRAAGTASAAIPFVDRIAWVAHDLVGMFLPYCAVTAVALGVAFVIAGGLGRLIGFRVSVFGLAGASASFVLFTAMKWLTGTVGVFGARGPAGLAAQMAAGALAGVIFARLTRRLNPPLQRTF
jgi:hypothetical protein